MPTFQYEARDRTGNIVRGFMEASDERDTAAQLREKGFWVTSVQRQSGSHPPGAHASPLDGLFLRVSLRDLAVFFRELSTMVKAGMSLYRALDVQANNSTNTTLRRILRDICPAILEGKPLSGEMAKYPTVFSPLLVGLVQAGELGGFLDRTLRDAADYLDKEVELRRKIRRQMVYPVLVCIFALLIATLVKTLIPSGTDVWQMQPVNLEQIFTRAWPVSIAQTLMQYWFVIALIVALWLLKRTSPPSSGIAKTLDAIKLYVPLFGGVVKKFALAKFARALSALYAAGISLARSLPIAADACGNAAIAGTVKRIVPQVEKGGKLSDLLRQSPYFTPMVIQMIVTGEETGSLDSVLANVADHYEAEAETTVHQMTVVVGPLLIIIIGFAVVLPQVAGFFTRLYGGLLSGAE